MYLAKRLLIGAAFTLLACQEGNRSSDVLIVGGEAVQQGDKVLKSTVAITGGGSSFCTGTIIGPRHVLSAAHCFLGGGARGVSVTFGVTAFSGNSIPLSQVFMHEHYDDAGMELDNPRSPVNDIALLVLESNIPAGYEPTPLAPPNLSIPLGARVVLAGYGVTRTNGSQADTLLKVDTIMGRQMPTLKEVEVGPTPGKGSCQGDSGGPAFYSVGEAMYVFGITSRGPECEAGVGIYTDVRQFHAWLESKGFQNALSAPLGNIQTGESTEDPTTPTVSAPTVASTEIAPSTPTTSQPIDYIQKLMEILLQTSPPQAP